MDDISQYIPLDKSWMIRMGVLDIVNSYQDVARFLEKQKILGDDLKALYRAARDWNSGKLIDVGESATLYRFLKFASWKLGRDVKLDPQGTLRDRKICNNPEIIHWPLQELLTLDGGTSQWASAAVLMGNKETLEKTPYKLRLTYETVSHWHVQRAKGDLWCPRFDETIYKQAIAFRELFMHGATRFVPVHSEDYCFARAFGLISPEDGERTWPGLKNHESDRIQHLEEMLRAADNGEVITSRDHRVVQAVVMRQKVRKRDVAVENKDAVNKSWPQFWDFVNYRTA